MNPYQELLWKKINLPIILMIVVFFFGSIGFKLLYPQESWINVFYMTAITLSTVGYGDVLGIEKNEIAELYTILLILSGMGTIAYSISSLTAFIVEGDLKNLLAEHSKLRRLSKMENHYIVCGAGDTGSQVIKELVIMRENCIVIEIDTEKVNLLKNRFPEIIIIQKDATIEDTLKEAKIESAKGLVATLSNDKDNLFLVITARFLNANIKIVSRANDFFLESKLLRAGANYIVSPNYIGGIRIASVLLRPHAVSFLDKMLRDVSGNFRVDEIKVEEGSYLANKTFKDSNIYKEVGVYIFAYYPKENSSECIYNPGPNLVIQPNSILIFIGNPEQHKKILQMAKPPLKS